MSARSRVQKVLVANRGEIAVRVMRTCRDMGIRTVAVYSDADRGSLHVRYADEAVHLGPSPARESYLVGEHLVRAAKVTGADAVHPGYGFLSESPAFARLLEGYGLTFVGPRSDSLQVLGVKATARERVQAAGVPVVPGASAPLQDEAEARRLAEGLGWPVMIKPAAGGGGKALKRCDRGEDFAGLWASARREAKLAFGDDRLHLEKLLEGVRHVEVQVLADERGETIHLGEREGSVQRRHQKILEESPSCVVDDALRERLGEAAVRVAQAVGYRGAGTVEFLVDGAGGFHFLEMNARLAVEHPVTELVTGLDLVRLQLEIAQGERIPPQDQVIRRGHAIEVRIYAEDPARKFLPSPGKLTYLRVPNGPGIRDDGGVYTGWIVPQHYDPLISKLLAWAPTRDQAIARLKRALGEYVVHGITVNRRYLMSILDHPAFRAGAYDTAFCARHEAELLAPAGSEHEEVAIVAAAVAAYKRDHDEAEAFAARAGLAQVNRSNWLRAGRARALRGGTP
jgi:acetyl-CoA carboxylase biotin carboxylase subunit